MSSNLKLPESERPEGWRRLSWAGARFFLPSGWSPARLTPQGLVLERGGRAVMTVWWTLPENRGYDRRAFEKGIAAASRQAGKNGESLIPVNAGQAEVWSAALPGVECRAFRRTAANGIWLRGHVLLPDGRGTCVLEFAPEVERLTRETALRACALPGMAGADVGGWTEYAVFGQRTLTPSGFRLTGSAFLPGHFALRLSGAEPALSSGPLELRYGRLAPADALLDQAPLAEWPGRLGKTLGPEMGPQPGELLPHASLETADWRGARRVKGLTGLLGARRRVRGAVWLDAPGNRLFCLQADGRGEVDERAFGLLRERHGPFEQDGQAPDGESPDRESEDRHAP